VAIFISIVSSLTFLRVFKVISDKLKRPRDLLLTANVQLNDL